MDADVFLATDAVRAAGGAIGAALHVFSVDGRHYVVDGHTGVFFRIDEVAREVLLARLAGEGEPELRARLSGRYPAAEVESALADLRRLLASGELGAPDPCAGTGAGADAAGPVTTLCLVVSQDCNLRCAYCYADAGAYAGTRRLMSRATAERAIDFLFDASEGARRLGITFFGGEPLLNLDVVKHAVAHAEARAAASGREIGFSLTTNGVLLTAPVRGFLEQHAFQVMVSLDGPEAVHDAARPLLDGRGSHAIVSRHLREALEGPAGGRYAIRATLTRRCLDLVGVVEHLGRTGCRDVTVELCSGPCGGHEVGPEDLPAVRAQYLDLARRHIAAAGTATPPPLHALEEYAALAAAGGVRPEACGAGRGYLAVDADGTLYPCHRLLGRRALALGDVEGGLRHPEVRERFTRPPSAARCQGCWARYLCGGGCKAHALASRGALDEPDEVDCELARFLTELGAHVSAETARPRGARGARAGFRLR